MLAVYELVAAVARGISVGSAIVAARITVAAFDIGMVGWMLLLQFNDLMPRSLTAPLVPHAAGASSSAC